VFVPGKLFPAYSNRHSSLVQKLVNYGQKSFITLTHYGEPIAKVGNIFIRLYSDSIKLWKNIVSTKLILVPWPSDPFYTAMLYN
jgi:hypothetical protein